MHIIMRILKYIRLVVDRLDDFHYSNILALLQYSFLNKNKLENELEFKL
jgi:hypothetical protein